jgi:vancomycin resistance protein YoaR
VDKVGEFTTPHACCETRVRNIQRMADLVRGVYLVPGERLSLNEFVGPRTVENGFFAAGAIRQGHLIQEVGGGVSQFATTIFNAAYFAGMDFEEYRSHTIYFSRYPYGREATISNPAPDLVMTNITEYPILVWTSYTDDSITVSMYSTAHILVEEIDQRTSRRGACTHVETDRQRTYPDGRVVVDTFLADYRPAEGIDCNGNPIPRPPG